eukprot:gene11807-13940_t
MVEWEETAAEAQESGVKTLAEVAGETGGDIDEEEEEKQERESGGDDGDEEDGGEEVDEGKEEGAEPVVEEKDEEGNEEDEEEDEEEEAKFDFEKESEEDRETRGTLRNGTQQKAPVKESIEIGQFMKMNEEALKPGVRHHVHNVVSVPKVVAVKNKKTTRGTKVKDAKLYLGDALGAMDVITHNAAEDKFCVAAVITDDHKYDDLGKFDGDAIVCALGDSEALRALEAGWKALKHP